MSVGGISSGDQVTTLVLSGRADLALAPPHLVNPHFTLGAAIEQGWRDTFVPPPAAASFARSDRCRPRQSLHNRAGAMIHFGSGVQARQSCHARERHGR